MGIHCNWNSEIQKLEIIYYDLNKAEVVEKRTLPIDLMKQILESEGYSVEKNG